MTICSFVAPVAACSNSQRRAGPALADAFDLGRMERIDFLAAVAVLLTTELDRQAP
jgi:hypothetical protein